MTFKSWVESTDWQVAVATHDKLVYELASRHKGISLGQKSISWTSSRDRHAEVFGFETPEDQLEFEFDCKFKKIQIVTSSGPPNSLEALERAQRNIDIKSIERLVQMDVARPEDLAKLQFLKKSL
jgi:hypothetical protein